VNPLLVVLLLALIGLLGAQLTFARHQVPLGPRIFVAVGGPFLLVGFILGPHLLQILTADTLLALTPLLALGLGWVGVLFGLQLDREHLRQFPPGYLAIAWLQAAVAFGVVYLVGRLIINAWFSLKLDAIILAAAATACVSTPAAIALISNTYRTRGRITRLLFYAASLDAAVGIVALSQELVLLLIGLVLFAAGAAFYLSLSPLFVCMIAGVVIGNLSPLRRRAYAALSQWEQPIYIMLLVLAGALLHFSSWWIVPLVAAYAGGRLVAKWVGGLVATRARPRGLPLPASFGLALTPQGGISLAMAISFVLVYVPLGPELEAAVNVFFATVVIAVGISDLIGPFLVRGVLERAGELDRRLAHTGAATDR
jgi:hypothetical protein